MSSKDRDRLKVLHEVRKRHITQVQAGKELGVTSRWVRELLRRMKARGDRAVVLGRYVRAYGRPLAVYTDKASLFQTAPKAVHHRQAPEAQPTQIGRALAELDIEWIAAHSPQAKGRVERFFGTAQDRLVKGLRKAGARNRGQANRYLQQVYLPLWNRRFTCDAEQAGDAHRTLDFRGNWTRY